MKLELSTSNIERSTSNKECEKREDIGRRKKADDGIKKKRGIGEMVKRPPQRSA